MCGCGCLSVGVFVYDCVCVNINYMKKGWVSIGGKEKIENKRKK